MLKRLTALFVVFLLALALSPTEQGVAQDARVPAYNSAAPQKGAKLPPILPKEQLWGDNGQFPYQLHAYEIAAKIPRVLHQLPCYCYCDRMGHNSLHSCFESTHGAQCSTCMQEAYYAYLQTKRGKTPAQIRKGVIAGEWKSVKLENAAGIQ